MREQEMRMRVFHFLRTRMRNMIMPATVGLGLAVGGSCVRSESTPVYSAPVFQDAAATKQDVAGTPIYSAPIYSDAPTAYQDGPVSAGDAALPKDSHLASDVVADLPQPRRDAQFIADLQSDSGPDVLALDGAFAADAAKRDTLEGESDLRDTRPAIDSSSDLGGMKYIAPFLDAGRSDASDDIGNTITKYLAQMPDAGAESTPATRYLAQMPDAASDSNVSVLYMAQLPRGV